MLQKRLDKKHSKYSCYKWTGCVAICVMSLVHGTFAMLSRKWDDAHDGDSNFIYYSIIVAAEVFAFTLYGFTLYMLGSSVHLLSKYANDHS